MVILLVTVWLCKLDCDDWVEGLRWLNSSSCECAYDSADSTSTIYCLSLYSSFFESSLNYWYSDYKSFFWLFLRDDESLGPLASCFSISNLYLSFLFSATYGLCGFSGLKKDCAERKPLSDWVA